MSNQPRSVWLALAAGALLLTLSVSSAFGADPPDGDPNRGQQVSDFVHDLVFGDQDSGDEDSAPDEDTPEDEETEDESTEEEQEATDEESADAPDNHGQCVRVVAMDPEAVGGPNENHGGAVSEAARETCWEDSDSEDSEDVESDDAATQEHGNSANAHDKQKGGNGHGHGHGGGN